MSPINEEILMDTGDNGYRLKVTEVLAEIPLSHADLASREPIVFASPVIPEGDELVKEGETSQGSTQVVKVTIQQDDEVSRVMSPKIKISLAVEQLLKLLRKVENIYYTWGMKLRSLIKRASHLKRLWCLPRLRRISTLNELTNSLKIGMLRMKHNLGGRVGL